MKGLLENYNESLRNIYRHVGLKEDWVICPLDTEATQYYWRVDGDIVKYAESVEEFENEEGEYYEDDLYTQRFYPKHVYRGEDFTLVFCDPHVDGMKWWRIFDNSKEMK